KPDTDRFPALKLARRAGETGGTLPSVLNAANEVAVEAFCARKITFDQISEVVALTMDRHQLQKDPTLDQILEADTWARATAVSS
ncbi:MAG TPA: 1-deoxy-D-xylulose-5-phosphate reductoisomerase, partial [Verrucomicrobiae bacterium]|nr:1-deoxy-D-xylulose-5-phosphate reductoisomerase [Verrucomicrobiae bacterium]